MSDVDPTGGGIHSGDPQSGSSLPGADLLGGWGFKWIQSLIGQVVKAIVGVLLPGDAFGQLQNWANVLLPDQIKAPIGALVNLLITALDLIPIFGPIAGDVVEYLANIFGLLNDNTTVAQESANTANSGVAELVARLDAGTTGELIIDSFDRAAAGDLGAAWTQLYASGAGTRGVDGAGGAVWFVSGAFTRVCINQHNTPLTTDTQVARFVLKTAPQPAAVVAAKISLILRCNAAADTYVEARITVGSCEIGCTVSGTYTRIGAAASITSSAGDLWEFRAGIGTSGDDPYTFQLLQNAVTVAERIDTGHVSQLGGSYLQPGWIDYAGQNAFFFVFSQTSPPGVAVFTATDRTP